MTGNINTRVFHDITRTISSTMPVYTGDPEPKFEAHSTIRDDKVNVSRIAIGSHTGTHVDAGCHFLPKGKGIDKEPLSKFIGEAIIVDLSNKRGEGITAKDLEAKDGNSRRGDILLLYTGTGNSRSNFTYVDDSAAQWIVDRGIKCVGIDTLSVEKFGVKDAPAHKLLLSKDIGIIENLDKLEQFINKRMFLVCLPLPLEGLDGSPARAVLFEMIK